MISNVKPCILISACLLGCNTRYKGDGQKIPEIETLMEHYTLIPVCPEQLGGLSTPRDPSEIQQHGDKTVVISCKGDDVTAQFELGAQETLKLAKLYGCTAAILKERSPSCGYGTVYDGTFSGSLIEGNGITAGLLAKNGIHIIGESHIHKLPMGHSTLHTN